MRKAKQSSKAMQIRKVKQTSMKVGSRGRILTYDQAVSGLTGSGGGLLF
jgi:hypothetical protein